jgi:hypothetical protein
MKTTSKTTAQKASNQVRKIPKGAGLVKDGKLYVPDKTRTKWVRFTGEYKELKE